jgi:hypothetical protein
VGTAGPDLAGAVVPGCVAPDGVVAVEPSGPGVVATAPVSFARRCRCSFATSGRMTTHSFVIVTEPPPVAFSPRYFPDASSHFSAYARSSQYIPWIASHTHFSSTCWSFNRGKYVYDATYCQSCFSPTCGLSFQM